MRLPLDGIRILDMTHMLPGPFCTMMLADMGAEVIKIENNTGGDSFRSREPRIREEGSAFHMLNRGKKSCKLNLRSPEGQKAFMALAKTADVIIEQFRPGVVERLGVDYRSVRSINPGVVYCSLSGFGQTGPYRDMPGHDINYLSISGILDTIGKKGEAPALPGIQIADLGGGAQWAMSAVLFGLMARDKNEGEGQYIDLAMTDCVLPWLSLFLSDYVADGTITSRGEAKSGGAYAFYNVYATADGRYVSLGAAEPKFWATFCTALGHGEWIAEQMVKGERAERLIQEVANVIKTKTQKEWTELLADRECCFTPVQNIEEALRDPQFAARGMVSRLTHPIEGEVLNIAFPLKFSDMSPCEPKSSPLYGGDTEELLSELGYGREALDELKSKNII
ncbi:MAG: CaiB/BaiF CoA-transferase family protein [Oscillospiraceae bacterium]